MSEPLTLALHSVMDCLATPLLERGIPQLLTFGLQEGLIKHVRDEHKSLIEHFPRSLVPLEQVDSKAIHLVNDKNEFAALSEHGKVAIHLTFSEDDPKKHEGGGLVIRLHDVLSADRSTPHGSMFHDWWQSAHTGQTPPFDGSGAYWCSPDDVAEGLLRLIGGGKAISGTIDVCGRRFWGMEDTWNEFQMLVSRTVAGHEASFHLAHLKADGGPAVHVEDLAVNSRKKARPSLEAVHDLLLEASGEGWNPRTPLRQSLMLIVADLCQHYGLD